MASTYKAKLGDTIVSKSSKYEVQEILGSGAFGQVTLCRKVSTNQTVALKVLKHPRHILVGQKEKRILKKLKELGSEHFHIVRWFDSFEFRGHYCHEFEKLDISLNEYLMFPFGTQELKAIRPIITQVAEALMFLKEIGVIHCDIKPENIMMVDHVSKPYQIKIIDFGISCSRLEANQGKVVQTLWYRAPEVLLEAPFDEAIDMWSLGCTAAEMFLGKVLFQGDDETDMMRHLVQIVGMPPQSLLDSGLITEIFFHVPDGHTDWKCKLSSIGPTHQIVQQLDDIYTWDPVIETPKSSLAEACDRRQFIDLIKRMLDMDPAKRITPNEVLEHPFITLDHFTDYHQTCDRAYVKECDNAMLQAFERLDEEVKPSIAPDTAVSRKGQTAQKRTRDLDEEDHQIQTRCKRAMFSQPPNMTVSPKGQTAPKQKRDLDEEESHVHKRSKKENNGDSSKKRKHDNSDNESRAKRRKTSSFETPEVTIITTPVSRKRKCKEEIVVIDLITPSPSKQSRLSAGPTPLRRTSAEPGH